MAPRRLSRLQRRILRCLVGEYQRIQGGTSLGHRELVQTLGSDPGNISHSVRTLEARGLITVGRTPGGEGGLSRPHASRPENDLGNGPLNLYKLVNKDYEIHKQEVLRPSCAPLEAYKERFRVDS